MKSESLKKLKATLPHKSFKILLVGESCRDVYHFGRTSRLSPEGPIPIFVPSTQDSKPGMASNVYENMISLGHSVSFLTNQEPIVKERYVDSRFNAHVLRVDRNEEVSPLEEKDLPKNLEDFDCLLISDYCKGLLRDEFCSFITENFSGPIFIDTKKKDLSCFKKGTIKVNEEESNSIHSISKECDLIVTRGKHGAVFKGKKFESFEADVFDVCGAGDVFLSSLASAYLNLKDLESAITFANLCASISVKTMGNHCLRYEEIYDALECYG